MGKIAYSVRPWNLGVLRSLMPCRCNEDPYKDCSFYINTKTSSMYIVGKGPKVVHVNITCNCCGQSTSQDVESMDIYENDLNF